MRTPFDEVIMVGPPRTREERQHSSHVTQATAPIVSRKSVRLVLLHPTIAPSQAGLSLRGYGENRSTGEALTKPGRFGDAIWWIGDLRSAYDVSRLASSAS